MKNNNYFKTSISSFIYLYWAILLILVLVILFHFNENPIGLIILLGVIVSPFFYNTIYEIVVSDNKLEIKCRNGFFITSRKLYLLNNIKVNIVTFPLSFTTGSVLLQGDIVFSLLFNVFTGRIFYQHTAIIEILGDEGKLINILKVNIKYKDAKMLKKHINR